MKGQTQAEQKDGGWNTRGSSRFAPALAALRGARPGDTPGKDGKSSTGEIQHGSGLMSWRRAARFRRTLVVVKRKPRSISAGPSCLERGSAASNRGQVDKSGRPPDELTHISMINRR